jgi:outer membrane protein, heavy metal efflux system
MHRQTRRTLSRGAMWFAAIVAAVFAAHAGAQDGAAAGASLGLEQAIAAAWSRQPEARSAAQRREAAAAQRRVADGWTPEPAAFESSLRTDRFTRNNGAREFEFGVAVPLWLPGERSRSQSLADAELTALDSRQRAAQWRTAGVVREAWWALHLSRQDVAAARVRLANTEQLANDVSRRLRAGDLARADQHQADAAVAAAQAELATTLAAQARSSNALRALVGGVGLGNVELLSADAEAEPALPVAVDAQHPAVAEWVSRAEASRRAQALAGVQTRAQPELTLLTTRERGVAGEPYGQTVTVGVRLPFGSDARSRNKAASAAADLQEAETALDLERDKLAAEADAASARLGAARTALQANERRAQLARETKGFIEKSFRLGQSDLPTRLRADLEATEAERQASRARIELAHAISSLRQALGLLPQ